MRRGGVLAVGSVAASALTTLCSLLATILILRVLPHQEAGRFAFLVELLYSVGLLGSLGQSSLLARVYYQQGAKNFDWVRDARSTILLTAPVVAAAVVLLAGPFRLSRFDGWFLFLGAALFILTSVFSSVLAQQRHYAWSSALVRLGNGLLIVPAILMLVAPSVRRIDFVLASLLVFLATGALLGGILLQRRLHRGSRVITFGDRLTGLVFLASILALVVPQRGLIVVAGALLEPATVAALAAVISILRVFDLIGESAGRVFSTEMAQHSGRLNAGLFVAPWLFAALLSFGALLVLPTMIHHFYNGRYDVALPLLPWMIIAAASRFVEIVPRGYLAYTTTPRRLQGFAAAQSAAAILGILLMLYWAGTQGAAGLVRASAAIAVARLMVSYLFMIPTKGRGAGSTPARQDLVVESLETRSQEPPI